MTVSIPTSLSHAAISASVSWRTWRVVVHSSILAFDAVLLADAVAVGVDPAAVLEDLLGLLGVERGRRLVRVEPRAGRDERVGDLGMAAEQPRC